MKPLPIGPLAIILRRIDAGPKQLVAVAALFAALLLIGIGLAISRG